MKTIIFAFIIIFTCAPSFARCKHPWLTDKYTTEDGKRHYGNQCWWDSERWYPQSAEVYDDFRLRIKNHKPIETEHPIDHWMVSFKNMGGMEGDCGEGEYRIIMRNSTPVPMEPEYRYEMLTVYLGSCGKNSWGANIRDDDDKTVKLPAYDFENEEKWVP